MMDSEQNNTSVSLMRGLRVLYVEDDPDTQKELSRFLKKRVGFLATASDGLEALDACLKYPIDIVITDLRMPGMDGLSFVRALRDRGSRCPVIITSAFSDSETIIQAVDLGIVKYCIKPLNTAELTLTLEKLAHIIVQEQAVSTVNAVRTQDREQKLEWEKIIRSEIAHMLKKLTGKGPKDIQVVLGAAAITICISGSFTSLELTLMNNPSNGGLITYVRKILYAEAREAIEEIISKTTGASATLSDIEIDTTENSDRITLHF